jgi:hypothetical protein
MVLARFGDREREMEVRVGGEGQYIEIPLAL